MTKIQALHRIASYVRETDLHSLTEKQVTTVWDAFMNRCGISMTEPDKLGWTDRMEEFYDCLWDSDLNPF